MLSFSELPRSGGMLTGSFVARHKSPSFSQAAFGFTFREGVTAEPVSHAVAARLSAAYGPDVSYEACDDDSLALAVSQLRERGVAEARIAEVIASHTGKAFAALAATEPPAPPSAASAPEASSEPAGPEPATPATLAELEAMSDDDARAVAASLGGTDKRWSAIRVRRFIADELGLE